MRTIAKGQEPTSLAKHRSTPGSDYDNYRDKNTLRTYLVQEQRGLCCYCLSRITADSSKMKIEHWHSQKYFPTEQLDYSNLLGACLGSTCIGGGDQSETFFHCDTRKGYRELSRNPANRLHCVEQVIRFRGDGEIVSDDPTFDTEINDILNLNEAFLKNNRKATLDGFTAAITKLGSLSRPQIERWLREWNGDSTIGNLRPFCQVVVFWLRNRLDRV